MIVLELENGCFGRRYSVRFRWEKFCIRWMFWGFGRDFSFGSLGFSWFSFLLFNVCGLDIFGKKLIENVCGSNKGEEKGCDLFLVVIFMFEWLVDYN